MTPGPAYLGEQLPEPQPVHGCAKCGALARQREHARAAGDRSGVSDYNVQIRRHPHGPPEAHDR
ncbi:hypothetical protein [Streptomyces sp. NPDC002611]